MTSTRHFKENKQNNQAKDDADKIHSTEHDVNDKNKEPKIDSPTGKSGHKAKLKPDKQRNDKSSTDKKTGNKSDWKNETGEIKEVRNPSHNATQDNESHDKNAFPAKEEQTTNE